MHLLGSRAVLCRAFLALTSSLLSIGTARVSAFLSHSHCSDSVGTSIIIGDGTHHPNTVKVILRMLRPSSYYRFLGQQCPTTSLSAPPPLLDLLSKMLPCQDLCFYDATVLGTAY